MKFTVVVKNTLDKQKIIKEFFNDTIIFLTEKEINAIAEKYNVSHPRDIDLLLKIDVIKKYKNILFLNSCGICPKEGLREEVIHIRKSKVDLILSNSKSLNDCDIFYSKKMPKYLKDLYKDFLIINDVNSLKKPLFLKKGIEEYSFDNVEIFEGLESLCEIAFDPEKIKKIKIIDLKQKDEEYINHLNDKTIFYIFFNTKENFSTWNTGSEYYFCGLKSIKDFICAPDIVKITKPDGTEVEDSLISVLEEYFED